MRFRHALCSIILAAGACFPVAAQNQVMLPENSVTKVSDHVYAIIGFPNIAIVVGGRAALAVDTGMGPKNGAIVARELQRLSKNPKIFLTTTHFHPEHSAGEGGFPPQTILIRPAAQQQELERRGGEFLDFFSSRSAQNKELLADVKYRTPDITFDRETTLDLGGVTARLFWLGAAHTKGDELIFVEPDRALISGDIVQNKLVPNLFNEDTSAENWLAILDKLEPLKPRYIVPDHGPLGDGSLIAQERAFLSDARNRALALKRQGTALEDASKTVTSEMKAKYPDWNINSLANLVRRVYAESN
jgi:glyoxylase-like metal-dependent hydrolase (beta-lactamase superfamily II)